MLRLTALGSGSRGNSFLIRNGSSIIAVDAGFGIRAMEKRIRLAGIEPEAIAALLITHEHTDHSFGAFAAAKRWGWPVFASPGTARALEALANESGVAFSPRCLPYDGASIAGFRVIAVPVSHDAVEPVAYVIEDETSGARAGLAVDLGEVSPRLVDAFERLDALVIESNHDRDMLRYGPYHARLKRRIASGKGHLSNRAAADFAATIAHGGLQHVIVAHLSQTNNIPTLATDTVVAVLASRGFRNVEVHASRQNALTEAVIGCRRTADRVLPPVQLSLPFFQYDPLRPERGDR